MSMIKRFTATVKECWSEAKQDEHIRVDHKHPRIGVCVIIFNEKRQILLGLRGQSHGAGKWALCGGHLEKWETWEDCAIREVKEETNLDIKNITFHDVKQTMFPKDGKHYNTIFLKAEVVEGSQEQVMEPNKFDPINWFYLDDVPNNLFGKLPEVIEQLIEEES
jgi:8-oxo-dGTP diphosphatase